MVVVPVQAAMAQEELKRDLIVRAWQAAIPDQVSLHRPAMRPPAVKILEICAAEFKNTMIQREYNIQYLFDLWSQDFWCSLAR